jgi:DNA-binding Lrp family transcriptional regulator
MNIPIEQQCDLEKLTNREFAAKYGCSPTWCSLTRKRLGIQQTGKRVGPVLNIAILEGTAEQVRKYGYRRAARKLGVTTKCLQYRLQQLEKRKAAAK